MKKFIYHANCHDGFCSAWLGHFVWPDAKFIPAQYGSLPPDVTNCDVIIADFSYKRNDLIEMHKKAKSLIVLDHHLTAKNDLEGLDFCVFDMDRSGARLTFDYLNNHFDTTAINLTEKSWLVDYVEDRDLWKRKLPNSNIVNASIRSYAFDFETWTALAAKPLTEIINEGVGILRYQQQIIDHHLKHLENLTIDGLNGKGCACSLQTIVSEVLAKVLEDKQLDFAASWYDTVEGERVYQLRSTNAGCDVSALALRYGGGGHRNASGVKITLSNNPMKHHKII